MDNPQEALRSFIATAEALELVPIEHVREAYLALGQICERPRPSDPQIRTLDKWTEEDGAVLWFRIPIEDPPWVGTRYGRPTNLTVWTPLPALFHGDEQPAPAPITAGSIPLDFKPAADNSPPAGEDCLCLMEDGAFALGYVEAGRWKVRGWRRLAKSDDVVGFAELSTLLDSLFGWSA